MSVSSPPYFKYGRGKEGTEYAGWYLCTGTTWTDGTIFHVVPNLNSFDYTISPYGTQLSVNAGDNSGILLGGYDISLSAVYDTLVGEYDVDFSNAFLGNNDPTSPSEFKFHSTGGNYDMYISRMIHIVYLEKDDLVWNNIGSSLSS
jgi:hypothetical protein